MSPSLSSAFAATRPSPRRYLFGRVSGAGQGAVLESLALLASSGVDAASALEATSRSIRDVGLRGRLSKALATVQEGFPLWQALDVHGILPAQRIWLIRVGEESGQLAKHLQTAVEQHRKEGQFRSRVRSAMLYPAILLSVALVVAVFVSWYILPRLAGVFGNLGAELPLLTRLLLSSGEFLEQYGYIAVPAGAAVVGALIVVLFVLPATRRSGQWLLLRTPGVGGLMRDSELARFGQVFGSLLQVGVPVPESLQAVREACPLVVYRRLYAAMERAVTDGESFAHFFDASPKARRLIPANIQQLFITAEQTGTLGATSSQLAAVYEGRLDVRAKNLAATLEPLLLFLLWIGVVVLASAVITPIYSILRNVN
ncbi:MAG TPA: type II secretion system F family protein [Candidatus Paceibacterota bacterium]|nr:type II secretion system F family protein [Candidatus Paceibacterota bacterium]